MTEVIFLPPAARFLKKIMEKQLKNLFKETIEKIQINHYFGESKTGDLKDIYCCDIFYNKTNYELAYTLRMNPEGEIVVVILAGTRENCYEEIKRYWK